MSASVSLQQLFRQFPGAATPAVAGVDLEVRAGETVCLVGPSGCGKSTTLRLIAGLEAPSSGDILIDGRSMAGVPPQARDVAMVFQGFALYPHLTVRRILEFPLKMRKMPRQQREALVQQTAEMLGLGSLLGRLPGELSGGERQRVAMGRAIVRKPKVFLFDEPLSNLDAALRVQLRSELGRLLRRLNATAVYVTHDQAEAMTLGNRIALMRAGHIEQLAAPRTIYEQPDSAFVASFFGSPPMNVVTVESTGQLAQLGNWRLPCPVGAGPVRLGIRPEHLSVSGCQAGGKAVEAVQPPLSQTPARVVGIEALGAETHLLVEVEGKTLAARVGGFETLALDDRVTLTLDPERIYWFSSDTGARL